MKKKRNARLEDHEIRRIEERVLSVTEENLPGQYYVVAVSFEKESGHWFLRIYVENPEGRISLKDCEEISRFLDPLVDTVRELDDLTFNLEVSSPGLNRVLRTEREFNFYRGQPVRVETGARENSSDGNESPPVARGLLEGYDPEEKAVLLKSDEAVVPVPLKENLQVVLDPEIKVPQ